MKLLIFLRYKYHIEILSFLQPEKNKKYINKNKILITGNTQPCGIIWLIWKTKKIQVGFEKCWFQSDTTKKIRVVLIRKSFDNKKNPLTSCLDQHFQVVGGKLIDALRLLLENLTRQLFQQCLKSFWHSEFSVREWDSHCKLIELTWM